MVSKNQEDMAMELDGTDNYSKNISPNLSENRSREESPKNGRKMQSRSERNSQIQQVIETELSDISRKTIENILEQVKTLTPTEHLLLYLKLPTECSNVGDPLRQPLNPLGSRSEISQTIMWIKTHLEEDPELSLPKQDVYNEYYAFCGPNKIKPLSTADFGKVMKQVYPRVRPRRLGTRGNSRYCYAGLRRRYKLDSPLLPDLNDKPQSSEFVSSSDDLLAAAWTIIKEWSEQQLGVQFSNLQSLAYYLVLNLSVGNGSSAATMISSSNKGNCKDSISPKTCNNKHREAQLQLQRKIHQKNELNREQKRKQLQSPKAEQRGRSKKCKLQGQAGNASLNTSPLASGESESNISTCEDIQHVCDKSIDFTNLQSLPDFSSFQKVVAANDQVSEFTNESYKPDGGDNVEEVPVNSLGKVPIPRLNNNMKFSPSSSPKRPKNVKYKAIQPKPEPCDIGLYNLQLNTGDFRSQETNYPGATSISETKQKSAKKLPQDAVKTELEDSFTSLTDASDSLFARERLISVGDIDKSALDDYLGTNNSQEHEEELVKYFENKDRNSDQDVSNKLTQLRQLLITQQNLESNSSQESSLSTVPILSSNTSAFTKTNYKNTAVNLNINQCYPKPYDGSNYSNAPSEGARRRVSFETYHPEEAVPPSPNTRRKNFNFTPISPGPLSPSGRQSKCSSTTVSPFVSPRNTPVPKAKGNIHQNVSSSYIINQTNPPTSALNFSSNQRSLISVKTNLKIKQENDNDSDRLINQSSDSELHNFSAGPSVYNYLPMSAPPSPKLALKSRNSNLLQKLLNSTNKPSFSGVNPRSQSVAGSLQDNLSAEITQLLSNNVHQLNIETGYRSQSVPLHQMSTKTNQDLLSPVAQNLYTSHFPFSSTNQVAIQNEFNDYNSFNSNQNFKLLGTIDSCPANLRASKCVKAPHLGSFSNITPSINNNATVRPDMFENDPPYKRNTHITQQCTNVIPNLRVLGRSQSIDFDINTSISTPLKCNPSRSVPTTPVPGTMSKFNFPRNRRSYPSTPLATNENFSYNHGQDYLLNGQPIKEKTPSGADIDPNLSFYQNTESNDEIYENVDIFNVNDTNLNCDILIEDNKNQFTFDGQLCDGNYNIKQNIATVLDENCFNSNGNQFDFKSGTNEEGS